MHKVVVFYKAKICLEKNAHVAGGNLNGRTYFEYIKNKIEIYFEELSAEALLQKPEGSEYTRLELILGKFRHQMWHVGLSSASTFEGKKNWNEFTGLNGIRKMIKMKEEKPDV